MLEVVVVRNENGVIERLWATIEQLAATSIAERSVFRIGLSGGSLIKYLANGAEKCKTDWSKWECYFCDERFVDETNDYSTFGQYKKLFIPKTSLNQSQFVIINRSISLNECAKDYERQIFEKFAIDKVGNVVIFELIYLIYLFIYNFYNFLFVLCSMYSQRIAKYLNLIYFCLEWVRMDIRVHYFPIIHC